MGYSGMSRENHTHPTNTDLIPGGVLEAEVHVKGVDRKRVVAENQGGVDFDIARQCPDRTGFGEVYKLGSRNARIDSVSDRSEAML